MPCFYMSFGIQAQGFLFAQQVLLPIFSSLQPKKLKFLKYEYYFQNIYYIHFVREKLMAMLLEVYILITEYVIQGNKLIYHLLF